MAYRVRLPPRLAAVHDVFQVSQLKKCVRVPTEIVEQTEILVEPDLSYVEYPIKVLDQKQKGSLEEKQLKCTRFNGVTIPKRKLPGKLKAT